ncbi:MAG TPA: MBOAT family O-acyltransferase, partial [Gemmataceae bacterium]
MIFSSKAFFLFLPVVLFVYHALLRRREHKYRFLLAASWFFYAWWSVWYVWVIVLITAIDYYAALRIGASADERARRRWRTLAVASNLLLLGYFKYTVFFLENTVALASLCGLALPELSLKILLPLGISFHTFQGIGYVMDVYRRQVPAVRSFVDFALFSAFFPQLVAGPIVRAHEFLPQMKPPPRVGADEVVEGFHWFLSGLFKKIFIADWLAQYVAPVYAEPHLYDAAAHWWATLAWTAQIYCDFCGYSEMAIGCALWFGFRLPRNFRFPYLAGSIADFWRRWHITLSTWLRDYLYFPLGGSRGGMMLACRNLMITFVLCGLWHGASWNWLLFGVYHGLLMCLHRLWAGATKGLAWAERLRENFAYRALAVAFTFYLVMLGM